MKFGEPTPDRTVTADGYMVGGAIMAPPRENRVKSGQIKKLTPLLLSQFFIIRNFVARSKKIPSL